MMDQESKPFDGTRPGVPISAATLPFVLFATLTILSRPNWPGIDRLQDSAVIILSVALSLPLIVLSATRSAGFKARLATVALGGTGAVFLFLHGGLLGQIAFNMDSGVFVTAPVVDAIGGVFLAAVLIPFSLIALVETRTRVSQLWFVLIPAGAGVVSQLAYFGLSRWSLGPSGTEYWLMTRTTIHGATGAICGLLVGAARQYHVSRFAPVSAVTARLRATMPGAPWLAGIIAIGLCFTASVRLSSILEDETRFATHRLDSYYLALSNLRQARAENLVYPELLVDLKKSRDALLGSTDFDAGLTDALEHMLNKMEITSSDHSASAEFRRAVLAVNRRLMAIGSDQFLEPHEITTGPEKLRFILRFRVTSTKRLAGHTGIPIAILRLRRMDSLMVDTPYAGISYPGLGTILMDNIDDTALKTYGRLLSPLAHVEKPEDGKFSRTRADFRGDVRAVLLEKLAARGHADKVAIERIAQVAAMQNPLSEISMAKRRMNAETLAAYDALCEMLARQTEIHEARHAMDGSKTFTLAQVEDLSPGPLGGHAAAEIRAHLTEIIEGTMGPHYATSTIIQLVAGENARANAYFFAGLVIMEGLWGEKIRKPGTVVTEGPDGPLETTVPIDKDNPGWLSYSRISTCYSTLRKLDNDELQTQARDLFKHLFGEEYTPVGGGAI